LLETIFAGSISIGEIIGTRVGKPIAVVNGVAIKKTKGGRKMAEDKGTIIELTEEQKEQMRQATGQEHREIKVETVGAQLSPRLNTKTVAKRFSPKLSMKKAAKRVAAKKAAKRLVAKKAAKRLVAKKAAKRAALKRSI
jgi:hypothetical protein